MAKKKHILEKKKKSLKDKLHEAHIKEFLNTFDEDWSSDNDINIAVVPEDTRITRCPSGYTAKSIYLNGKGPKDPRRTEWMLKSKINKSNGKITHTTYQLVCEGEKVPKRDQKRDYGDDYYKEDNDDEIYR